MGGGGGMLASRLCTNARTKNNEKGYFFFKLGSAQPCHRLGSEKQHFSGKRVGFLKFDRKNAVIRSKIQTENIVERVPVFLYFEHTVQDMFRNPLFKQRYQADLEAPPPHPRFVHI